MKYRLTLTLAMLTSLCSVAHADSSVGVSMMDDSYVLGSRVEMQICQNPTHRAVKQGSRIQPSNDCRVLNYYTAKNKFIGSIKIPEGIAFEIPWGIYKRY